MTASPATSIAQSKPAPEACLAWLWIYSVGVGGVASSLYFASTTTMPIGTALLLMPFLHVVVSIPVFLLLLLGTQLVRGHYQRLAAEVPPRTPGDARAWGLLAAWAALHALTLFALTFPFLLVFSKASALLALAGCLTGIWIFRRGLLRYLTNQTGSRNASWVDRGCDQRQGTLHDSET